MLSQVVSRVRRHFRRSQNRNQQPPDLRRWSDFMNPFPPVSPGGYRRYYEKHGIPEPKAAPTPASSPIEGPPSPSASSSALPPTIPFPSGQKRTRTRTLSTIPESIASSTTGTPNVVRVHNLSNTSSLRRRRRRLLRTPSVERDFPVKASIFPSQESDYISSNESSLSHSSHSDSIDTPATTVEGVDEDDPPLLREEACLTPDDPYERSESRSSYCTARSDFSDV